MFKVFGVTLAAQQPHGLFARRLGGATRKLGALGCRAFFPCVFVDELNLARVDSVEGILNFGAEPSVVFGGLSVAYADARLGRGVCA